MSAVHQFVNIGQHAYIAGGSLVSKDVPPYIKAVRNPLSYGGVNSVGLKRRGFDPEIIAKIKEAYQTLLKHIEMWDSDDYFTDEQLETAKTMLAIQDAYSKKKAFHAVF